MTIRTKPSALANTLRLIALLRGRTRGMALRKLVDELGVGGADDNLVPESHGRARAVCSSSTDVGVLVLSRDEMHRRVSAAREVR